MGNNCLRRIINKETKWTDPNVSRHKHDFSIEACVELRQDNMIGYHHVMKCKYCYSFKCIGTENNCTGFSTKRISGLPLIKMYRTHKTIGFNGAIVIKNRDEL